MKSILMIINRYSIIWLEAKPYICNRGVETDEYKKYFSIYFDRPYRIGFNPLFYTSLQDINCHNIKLISGICGIYINTYILPVGIPQRIHESSRIYDIFICIKDNRSWSDVLPYLLAGFCKYPGLYYFFCGVFRYIFKYRDLSHKETIII